MPNLVTTLIEPSCLYLYWQAADLASGLRRSGSRYCVGKIEKDSDTYTLTYLTETPSYIRAVENGFAPYPAFNNATKTYDNQVLETFLRRIPPRSRADYPEFLRFYGIQGTAETTNGQDFAILGYCGAKSPGDGFSLVHPFDTATRGDQFPVEIAGFRHSKYGQTLIDQNQVRDGLLGKAITFVAEPDNKYDTQAVQILLDEGNIGYVNTGQTAPFRNAFQQKYSVNGQVIRVNGHQHQPSILVVVSIS